MFILCICSGNSLESEMKSYQENVSWILIKVSPSKELVFAWSNFCHVLGNLTLEKLNQETKTFTLNISLKKQNKHFINNGNNTTASESNDKLFFCSSAFRDRDAWGSEATKQLNCNFIPFVSFSQAIVWKIKWHFYLKSFLTCTIFRKTPRNKEENGETKSSSLVWFLFSLFFFRLSSPPQDMWKFFLLLDFQNQTFKRKKTFLLLIHT